MGRFLPLATALGALGALLGSCASLDTRLPDIGGAEALSVERDRQQTAAFADIAELQSRLMRVADPIRVANAELCPRTRLGIGLKTHSLSNYAPRLRDAARRELGAQDTPRVFVVVEGSPAERAGIRRGDALLVGGEAVSHSSRALLEALESGRLAVQDPEGRVREVEVSPRLECAYDVKMRTGSSINAFATGRSIVFSAGMIRFAESDDELALIVGHELAHNTMGHVSKIVGSFILSLGQTRHTRPFESEADYVGLYYMARAGFMVEGETGVEDVWRRLALVSPRNTARASTHPTTPERFLRIRAARAEIAAKREAGLPLVPNFVDGEGDDAAAQEDT